MKPWIQGNGRGHTWNSTINKYLTTLKLPAKLALAITRCYWRHRDAGLFLKTGADALHRQIDENSGSGGESD